MEDNDRVIFSNQQLKSIEKSVGKKAIVLVNDKGQMEEYIGVLDLIQAPESICIKGKTINFLNSEYAIIGIKLESGEVLYYNPYVTRSYGTLSHEENIKNMISVARLMFGLKRANEIENKINDIEELNERAL